MKRRFLEGRIEEALADTPILFLNGSRQVGKSTLLAHIHEQRPKSDYVTLDDLTMQSAAQSDPHGFLERYTSASLFIDEVQRAPELFLAIKRLVDKERHPGRFLLTGSANVLPLPQLADSLAGRMEIVSLYPFSIGELQEIQVPFFSGAFQNQPTSFGLAEDVYKRVVWGGYPEVQTRVAARRRVAWFDSYVATVLQRDVRELANIENLIVLPKLLKVLAHRSATLLNFDEIARAVGLPTTTLRRYFSLFQLVFLIDLLPAWSTNRGKRLVKSPKLFFNDTGLFCYLLGIDEAHLARHPGECGRVFETFILSEVMKMLSYEVDRFSPFHFRSLSGHEVDIVVESFSGAVVGIEVKGSRTVVAGDFAGLRKLAEYSGEKFACGIILYMGKEIVSFGKRLHAVPIGLAS